MTVPIQFNQICVSLADCGSVPFDYAASRGDFGLWFGNGHRPLESVLAAEPAVYWLWDDYLDAAALV
jgi:hypothetical protein